jgi:two-component system, OmpR family, response regulator
MLSETKVASHRLKLFLVDDDALFLKSSEIEFNQQDDFIIETYATGELCMQHLSHSPDIVILDYRLDGITKNAMNGIQTLDKIKRFNSDIVVVMLSAQDKIEVAVDCMQHRAFDYVVKSKNAFRHLQNIIAAIKQIHLMQTPTYE